MKVLVFMHHESRDKKSIDGLTQYIKEILLGTKLNEEKICLTFFPATSGVKEGEELDEILRKKKVAAVIFTKFCLEKRVETIKKMVGKKTKSAVFITMDPGLRMQGVNLVADEGIKDFIEEHWRKENVAQEAVVV